MSSFENTQTGELIKFDELIHEMDVACADDCATAQYIADSKGAIAVDTNGFVNRMLVFIRHKKIS